MNDGYITATEYLADLDAQQERITADVLARAKAHGIDPEEFESIQDCDFFLQSKGW